MRKIVKDAVSMSISIPGKIYLCLSELANVKMISMSAVAREAIVKYIEHQSDTNGGDKDI